MSSVIDICNLALSHLGDDGSISSIDPPEGSAQAEHCANFYPIARDAILEHPDAAWGFATRRDDLALLVDEISPWAYVYSKPNLCLRIIDVLFQDSVAPQPYQTETLSTGVEVILTNVTDAQIRYIVKVTDTTKYSQTCVMAMSYLLASFIAGPLLKGDAGMKASQAMAKMAQFYIGLASRTDANQRRKDNTYVPSSIGAR